jgi:hypothetical protein
MPDPHETLVRWYLRFNGYLGVESFVVHELKDGKVPEGAEFDTLAVRFPFSRESAGFLIRNDSPLWDKEAEENSLIDFVIAEVKGGAKPSLNKIWRLVNCKYTDRMAYVIRWLGPFREEETILGVASDLCQKQRAVRDGYLFRLIYFAKRRTEQAVSAHVPQITFKDIAKFIVEVRVPCWANHGLGIRSQHEQWDPMIRKIWDIADPATPGELEAKISEILAYVDSLK